MRAVLAVYVCHVILIWQACFFLCFLSVNLLLSYRVHIHTNGMCLCSFILSGSQSLDPTPRAPVPTAQLVEQVQRFKYFGAETDTCLSFSQHADSVYKKTQQCLHLPRKLRTFNISKDILTSFNPVLQSCHFCRAATTAD